jgi:hypothetical protein
MDTADYVLSAGCGIVLGLFPSDLLPQSIAQSGTLIINNDPQRRVRTG